MVEKEVRVHANIIPAREQVSHCGDRNTSMRNTHGHPPHRRRLFYALGVALAGNRDAFASLLQEESASETIRKGLYRHP